MKCCLLLLSFEGRQTFQEAKRESLCFEKQHKAINWLNFSCSAYLSRPACLNELQKETDQNLQVQLPFNPAAQTQSILFLVPWMKYHLSWKFKHNSITSHRLYMPLRTNASELHLSAPFSSGIKSVFKYTTLSVGAICLILEAFFLKHCV